MMNNKNKMPNLKIRSNVMTDGDARAPNRAMLRAVGFRDDDFKKPIVGIASTWSELTPCNFHINRLAETAKESARHNGAVPLIFNTITVSDGISMGHEGMKYSLPSREIIADSVELVSNAERFDGLIAIGGCDKNMPACIMAMARLNIPSVFIYGGTIMPGMYQGKDIDIVSVFEAVGKYSAKKITKEQFHDIECSACPGSGSCGGMYTANTMACAIEALGMSLPNSSSMPAESDEKKQDCSNAAKAAVELLKKNICPKDILTKKAFENAITVVIALGGSTNSVLHLIAIAKAAGVNLTLDDFRRISDKTPVLADMKPSGKYVMADLFKAGGTAAVMKLLLKADLLHGNSLTVTGKTMEQNLKDMPDLRDNSVIRRIDDPVRKIGHIAILKGNIAPEGAVAKISKQTRMTGRCRVFDSEEEALKAILGDKVMSGEIIVIRYEGPKGGPGMREMLAPTSAVIGKNLDVGLITDGRFSGGTHGMVVGHICPEAMDGGPIAALKDGDVITIDAEKRLLAADLTAAEIKARLKSWKPPKQKYASGVLAKYARLVSSASEGAVTDEKKHF